MPDPSLITYLGDKRYPRGLRNNNISNIRRSRANWLGKIPFEKSKDKDFEQFYKYWHGYRAMLITLRSYYFKHNLTTIRQIIERWAPPGENDTESYINSVCKRTGHDPDQKLIWDPLDFKPLCEAIGHHESGVDPKLTQELFDYAWGHI